MLEATRSYERLVAHASMPLSALARLQGEAARAAIGVRSPAHAVVEARLMAHVRDVGALQARIAAGVGGSVRQAAALQAAADALGPAFRTRVAMSELVAKTPAATLLADAVRHLGPAMTARSGVGTLSMGQHSELMKLIAQSGVSRRVQASARIATPAVVGSPPEPPVLTSSKTIHAWQHLVMLGPTLLSTFSLVHSEVRRLWPGLKEPQVQALALSVAWAITLMAWLVYVDYLNTRGNPEG